MKYSPGIICTSSDRLVHGDELGAVRERRLDLDLGDHFGDAVHHLGAADDVGAGFHQFGDATPVARAFDDEIRDQRNRFGMIELDAAFEPPPRHHRRHGDQQLVFLARGELHGSLQFSHSRGNGAASSAVSTATRSRRSAAPSLATSRATTSPFQADMPTSLVKRSCIARTATASPSLPGYLITLATATPPLAMARCARRCAMSPSRRSVSAKTSAPPTCSRQRSKKRPWTTVSPMAERPNTAASANSRLASRASSTSMLRRSRA